MTGELPGPWGAALYETRITHVRRTPLRHAFQYRGYLWLVDLDRLPPIPRALRPLARFRPADHSVDQRGGHNVGQSRGHNVGQSDDHSVDQSDDHGGGQAADQPLTLRQDLERYLAAQGVGPAGGRVLMLAQARSLGHVFNPLTVYWCHGPDGRPLCTVAEVHNTYGGRHRYLLLPDERGRAETAKEFYVSPFFPVDGSYRMSLPEPGERLDLTIHLERPGGRAFTATVHGARRPAGPAELLRAAVRHPFPTLAVSARIRLQGIRLLLRGLPVQPRPLVRPCPPADPSRPPDQSCPSLPSVQQPPPPPSSARPDQEEVPVP